MVGECCTSRCCVPFWAVTLGVIKVLVLLVLFSLEFDQILKSGRRSVKQCCEPGFEKGNKHHPVMFWLKDQSIFLFFLNKSFYLSLIETYGSTVWAFLQLFKYVHLCRGQDQQGWAYSNSASLSNQAHHCVQLVHIKNTAQEPINCLMQIDLVHNSVL
jgi:hypothetical protein